MVEWIWAVWLCRVVTNVGVRVTWLRLCVFLIRLMDPLVVMLWGLCGRV